MYSDDHTEGGWINPHHSLESPERGKPDYHDIVWFNPRRPIAAPPSRTENPTGGGKPITFGDGGWINPRRPLVPPIYQHRDPASCGKPETLAPRRGKGLRRDATPTAMTSASGVLNGGASPPDLKPGHNCSTDPPWIYKSRVEEWWESDDGIGDAIDDVKDESISYLSPLYFPWKMAGETWEAAKVEAEKWIK